MKVLLRITAVLTLAAILFTLAACTANGNNGTDDTVTTDTDNNVVTTAGNTEDPKGDDAPGDDTPGDDTPGDDTPGDDTPGDDGPGDGTDTGTGDDGRTETDGGNEDPASYVDLEFAEAFSDALASVNGIDIVRKIDLEYRNLLGVLINKDLSNVKVVNTDITVKTDADNDGAMEATIANDDGTWYRYVKTGDTIYRDFTFDGVTEKEYTVLESNNETSDGGIAGLGISLDDVSALISKEVIMALLTQSGIDFTQAFGRMEVEESEDGGSVITVGDVNSGLINSYVAMILPDLLEQYLNSGEDSESGTAELIDTLLQAIGDDSLTYDLTLRFVTDPDGNAVKLDFHLAASVEISTGLFSLKVDVISLTGICEYERTDVTVEAPSDAETYTEISNEQFFSETLAVLTGTDLKETE